MSVFRNGFVNWDDPTVLLNNSRLAAPGVLAWSFTSTLIGHYQPLAWLAWSAVKSAFGLTPAAFHGLSLLGHVANTVLVYVVALRLVDAATFEREKPALNSHGRVAALTAAALFAVHPLRVEAVAWASAFPYVLSLTLLLLAFLFICITRPQRGRPPPHGWGFRSSRMSHRVWSGLRRSVSRWYLLLVDDYPLRRPVTRRLLSSRSSPFVIAAAVFAFAEWHARDIVSLQEVGLGARMDHGRGRALYLSRQDSGARGDLPARLRWRFHPALPSSRLPSGCAGLAGVTLISWRARGRWPVLGVAWIAFALTLAPVVGVTPSGLQATADRYMYVPGVIVSLAIGFAVARHWPSGRLAVITSVVAAATVAVLGGLTWIQTGYWHDSIALWTPRGRSRSAQRHCDLQPRHRAR